MLQLASQIEAAAAVVRQRWATIPEAGIILGSGLGGLADELKTEATIDYAQIPHFPRVSALGHRGQLVCGTRQYCIASIHTGTTSPGVGRWRTGRFQRSRWSEPRLQGGRRNVNR